MCKIMEGGIKKFVFYCNPQHPTYTTYMLMLYIHVLNYWVEIHKQPNALCSMHARRTPINREC